MDMQRTLEAKKKGVFLGPPGRVKVARPSDGEDDFESGLVIGADEDLSPSRLKKPNFIVIISTQKKKKCSDQLNSNIFLLTEMMFI